VIARALLLALVCVLALAGCVSLPTSGPVRAGPSEQGVEQEAPFEYTPGGPERGDTRDDIVRGFLTAMTATPLNTFVARQYLTTESSSSWVPEKGTVVYGTQERSTTAAGVRLALTRTVELDGRGEWLGDPTDGKGLSYRLRLVREKGQWRISGPPDRLIIPQAHFETRFQQYFLYFFDKSAQVLVPEPVYLPVGPQAPTLLMAGLLRGPDRDLIGVERTFVPARTVLDDISVPVARDGTAQVPLSNDVLDLDDENLDRVFAQVAWTLAQVPGIDRMSITVDGSPIDLPGEGPDVDVGRWSEYDPAVAWASPSLFGLRNGRVVTVLHDQERRISGVFGALDVGLRSIGVDLPAEHVAGVTASGRTVLTGSRNAISGGPPKPQDARLVYAGGTDVLRPVYDLYGWLWLVDRTAAGAALSVVRGGAATPVDAPGITGTDVRSFILSRDGTRLVAVVRRDGHERVVVARVQRDHSGWVRRVDAASPLPLGVPEAGTIRDLAWRTPGSVAVLAGPTPGTSRLIVVKVDGSSALEDVTTDAELLHDQAVRLVTSPLPGAPLYVGTETGQLFALAANGRWTSSGIRAGLVSPTFVG
jgi:hypothetical protein